MPSIIIPTKKQLTTYTANPSQIVKDAESTDYFVNQDSYRFLTALNSAIIAGATSVSYYTTLVNADTIKTYLTTEVYGYGYATDDFTITTDQQMPTMCTLVLAWAYIS